MDAKLLEILACPACKGQLKYVQQPTESLDCGKCAKRFEVKDGIPILLIEEAKSLDG
ncbi:MAG TPA: hypothetical protein DD417_00975 [Elusimicrobia bacterium]|nr:hypothetical protein [Elusimicrobiota bacterium]